MKKLTTALLCLLMVFSCAFCVNAEDATEVLEETPVEVQNEIQEAETKVAKIGEVEYATLQEAIRAAKNGEEIELLNDVKEYINVPDKTKAVLKMNGKTIDCNTEFRPTFIIEDGAEVQFQGQGYIYNTANDCGMIVNYGRCRINDLTIFATKGKKGVADVIYNSGLLLVESSKITASDGLTPRIFGKNEFVVTGGELGNGKLLIEEKDTHNFKLYGGTYNCSEKDVMYFLGDGCCFAKDSEGLITIVKADATAKIGDVEYSGLQDAINAAQNGEEIVLLKDVEEDIIVSKDTNAILNVNGKSINNISSDTITNYGNMTISGEGNLNNKSKDKAIIVNNGNLIIDGPEFYGGRDLKAQIVNKNNLTIENGTFFPWTSTWVLAESGKTVIKGGVFGNSTKGFESTKGIIELRGGRYSSVSQDRFPIYLADGYCFTINEEDGRIEAVKKTETSVKEPTVVGNKENIDSVKETKGLEDVTNVGIKLEKKLMH